MPRRIRFLPTANRNEARRKFREGRRKSRPPGGPRSHSQFRQREWIADITAPGTKPARARAQNFAGFDTRPEVERHAERLHVRELGASQVDLASKLSLGEAARPASDDETTGDGAIFRRESFHSGIEAENAEQGAGEDGANASSESDALRAPPLSFALAVFALAKIPQNNVLTIIREWVS